MHGGAGVSADTPLPGFFAQARSLRIADGPDEVHLGVIARIELARQGAGRGPLPVDGGRAGAGQSESAAAKEQRA